MPNNYVLLETIALTQSAASVTFDNLPTSGYTDLKIVASARTTGSSTDVIYISLNGSASNFSGIYMQGAGSGTPVSQSLARFAGQVIGTSFTASTFANTEIYIPNAFGLRAKSFSVDTVTENNATLAYATLISGLWNPATQAAISSITLTPGNGSFDTNSTFSLYGIAALGTTPVLAPKATGGNIVANDGTYWYHAFTSSGFFTPQVGLTCDYLVVAGGGSGGSHNGGGGGAGGYLTASGYSVSSGTAYATTVGAGAAAVATPSTKGLNGNNSVFATITATGGGGGGSYSGTAGNSIINGVAGGSGGGSSMYAATTAGTPGAASPSGQGNAGGTASLAYAGGGGGGAGAVGGAGNVSFNVGGVGGNGLNTLSAWATVTLTGASGYFAGGGGGADGDGTGGAGGAGGGGAGSGYPGDATSATANTGGGGGGAGFASSGAGGSGIVIIRYPIA